jgi:hypothetical protein
MSESVNTCDLNCPKKALMGIELRTNNPGILDESGQPTMGGVVGALPSGKAGELFKTLGQAGAGVRQMQYAATECPSRSQPAEEWQPSDRCQREALGQAALLQPFESKLTEWETQAVGRIGLGPDLRPVTDQPDGEQPPEA